MAGTSSVSGRSRDSRQGEDASLESTPSSDTQQGTEEGDRIQGGPDRKLESVQDNRNWTLVFPSGNMPRARYYHAAAVIGRKMLVVGGDSDLGMLNDVQQLHLGKLSWSGLGTRSAVNVKTKVAQQLPPCRGHSLIAWGQKLLLVTGETDPPMETVSVWSFDMEKENWSMIEAKGEIPVARSGHSVTRAGSVLILFGGEAAKGRKLNDLHMFDLKSSMWLPLLAMGSVPSPRSKHVAAIYDDRLLLVFGGASKSKFLNDLYALDFEAMEWSRLKTRGVSPRPRAECAGVLFGDNWYIAGGGSNDTRCLETIMLDVARMTWSVVAHSNVDSPSVSQGFSMVIAQRKERAFLVAFGGKKPGSANEVEVLHISAQEHIHSKIPTSSERVVIKGPDLAARKTDQSKTAVPVYKDNLITDNSGAMPLRERSQQVRRALPVDEDSRQTTREYQGKTYLLDELPGNQKEDIDTRRDTEALLPSLNEKVQLSSLKQASDSNQSSYEMWKASQKEAKQDVGIDIGQADTSEGKLSSLTELKISYEKKLAAALRKSAAVEVQLKVTSTSRDEAERNLATVIKSRQKAEKRLAVALKENEDLKEKLAAAELAQEESVNLTNIVHAENLRLDHDLAFLKAVLEDTQKELQTTRGVLSGERSRAFQLQVELFELKQRIQSYQNGQNP